MILNSFADGSTTEQSWKLSGFDSWRSDCQEIRDDRHVTTNKNNQLKQQSGKNCSLVKPVVYWVVNKCILIYIMCCLFLLVCKSRV